MKTMRTLIASAAALLAAGAVVGYRWLRSSRA